MKTNVLITAILLMVINSVNAQTIYEDVVYLKNGSIIRGMIIEQVPNQLIKIQTGDRNVFVFKMEEIEKMTKEASQVKSKKHRSTNEYKSSGFTNMTELGALIGIGKFKTIVGDIENDATAFSISTVNGYLVNPTISFGLGLGLDVFNDGSFLLLPIFFDTRINFIEGQFTPFVQIDAGYSLGWIVGEEGANWGGLIINPGIGLKTFMSNSTAFNIIVSYRIQKLKTLTNITYSIGGSQIYEYEGISHNFISIKAGFAF